MARTESDEMVDIGIVRSLALVGARIAGGRELSETFQAIVDGVVEVLGFGAAALNHRLPNGDYRVTAVAGPGDARDALLGVEFLESELEEALVHAVPWGPLIYVPPGALAGAEFTWTDPSAQSEASLSDGEWHPDAALMAPVHDESGRLVAALSVDVPPNGRTPSAQLRELLGIFALQAGVAITAASARQLDEYERNRRESRLERLARLDPLTGLPHRGGIEQELGASIDEARRTGRDGAVLFCDVDRLKRVNDRLGHAAGDEVLRASAAILRQTVRARDVVIRYGGDEFVVVARDISASSANALADRIRDLVREPAEAEPAPGFSVGVAVIGSHSTPAELLKRADAAMYEDKVARREPPA
ncbi:MAG: GGDEF domain-containing protein [Actinomycetia bacterium]|nr:GGDEF domain-containing protein [Actinomycetes bacterium]